MSVLRRSIARASESVGPPRFRTFLLAALSLLALLMASIGIFGVTNYTVETPVRRETAPV
jgi:hypothetical protein